jgi:hypothetical protein
LEASSLGFLFEFGEPRIFWRGGLGLPVTTAMVPSGLISMRAMSMPAALACLATLASVGRRGFRGFFVRVALMSMPEVCGGGWSGSPRTAMKPADARSAS